jgi:iron-sulfur cluster repair protein YtfE (RIC family)
VSTSLPPQNGSSFLSIEAIHDQIHAAFQEHQVELVSHGLTETGFITVQKLFLVFQAAMQVHIRVEDEILIPVFAQHCPKINGCSPEILLAEHRKLERLLDRTACRLQLAADGLAPEDIILIIEEERMIKEVMEHHAIRETAGFFPTLDRHVSPAERRKLLAQCDRMHKEAEALHI